MRHLSSGLWEELVGHHCLLSATSTGLAPALTPVLGLISSCCPEPPAPTRLPTQSVTKSRAPGLLLASHP